MPRSGSLSDFRSKSAYLQNQQIGSMAKMLFLPEKQGQVSLRVISCPLLLKFFSIVSPYFTIKTAFVHHRMICQLWSFRLPAISPVSCISFCDVVGASSPNQFFQFSVTKMMDIVNRMTTSSVVTRNFCSAAICASVFPISLPPGKSFTA